MLIAQLASAIASHEGWFKPASLAERNCNPGNLRASFLRRSKAAGFVEFLSREEALQLCATRSPRTWRGA